jgi:hypothetical protein
VLFKVVLGWKSNTKDSKLVVRQNLLDYVQLVGVLASFKFAYPPQLAAFLQAINSGMNLDLTEFSCVTARRYTEALPLKIFSTLILLAGLALFIVIEFALAKMFGGVCCRRLCGAARPVSFRQFFHSQGYTHSIAVSAMFMYSICTIMVATASFGAFNCIEVGNARYLSADLSIACDEGATYSRILSLAYIGIFQVVVLPLFLVVFLYFALKHGGGWSPGRQGALGVFYSAYTVSAWWYETVRILRKVLWVCIAQLVASSRFQLMYCNGLLMGSLVLTAKMSPYMSNTANRLEVFSQSILAACLLIAAAYFIGEFSQTSEAVHAGLLVVVALIVVFTCYVVVVIKLTCCNASDPKWQEVKRGFNKRASGMFRITAFSVHSMENDQDALDVLARGGLELMDEIELGNLEMAESSTTSSIKLKRQTTRSLLDLPVDPQAPESILNLPEAPSTDEGVEGQSSLKLELPSPPMPSMLAADPLSMDAPGV